MKIHSPAASGERTETVEGYSDDAVLSRGHRETAGAGRYQRILPGQWREMPDAGDSWADGEGGNADRDTMTDPAEERGKKTEADPAEEKDMVPAEICAAEENGAAVIGKGNGSLLEGLLGCLGSEDWLLILVILLLVADGSDAWDLILLLGVLLAVK